MLLVSIPKERIVGRCRFHPPLLDLVFQLRDFDDVLLFARLKFAKGRFIKEISKKKSIWAHIDDDSSFSSRCLMSWSQIGFFCCYSLFSQLRSWRSNRLFSISSLAFLSRSTLMRFSAISIYLFINYVQYFFSTDKQANFDFLFLLCLWSMYNKIHPKVST